MHSVHFDHQPLLGFTGGFGFFFEVVLLLFNELECAIHVFNLDLADCEFVFIVLVLSALIGDFLCKLLYDIFLSVDSHQSIFYLFISPLLVGNKIHLLFFFYCEIGFILSFQILQVLVHGLDFPKLSRVFLQFYFVLFDAFVFLENQFFLESFVFLQFFVGGQEF